MEAKKNAKLRAEALTRKFKKLYGVKNHLDPKYFDLVIDTTNKTPEQVLEIVLAKLE
jgi:cytidylate kinase